MADVVYTDLGLAELLKRITETSAKHLRVGLVGPKAEAISSNGRDTVAVVGIINEFGGEDDTNPPRRSWLHEPMNRERPTVTKALTMAAKHILDGQSVETALDEAGGHLANIPKRAIMEGLEPGNADATVKSKGFDHPLYETGQLVEAITHQVVRSTGDILEAGSSAGDYEAFEIGGEG